MLIGTSRIDMTLACRSRVFLSNWASPRCSDWCRIGSSPPATWLSIAWVMRSSPTWFTNWSTLVTFTLNDDSASAPRLPKAPGAVSLRS